MGSSNRCEADAAAIGSCNCVELNLGEEESPATGSIIRGETGRAATGSSIRGAAGRAATGSSNLGETGRASTGSGNRGEGSRASTDSICAEVIAPATGSDTRIGLIVPGSLFGWSMPAAARDPVCCCNVPGLAQHEAGEAVPLGAVATTLLLGTIWRGLGLAGEVVPLG